MPVALLIGFLFSPFSPANAQMNGLRKGKLANGLTYYIYNDGSATGEAQYYLYQNVGAILENDEEMGLAHVLEHLAFNTTDHFPNGVMNFLRSNNLNDFEAFTGVDDTRYAVHNVPTNDAKLNENMLWVLRDWCHGVKMTPKDIEKERGIILEEWRHRSGVDRRLTDAIAPVVYNHAGYATHNVIGSQKILETFQQKQVKLFYDKWYRPNMQFIAVIGDVDVDQMEKNIQTVFKTLPAKQAPAVNPQTRQIPDNTTPLYMRFIDPENKSASFGLYQRYEVKGNAPEEDRVRQFIFTKFFNTLAPKRFVMLKNADKESYIAAEVSLSPLVRNYYQMAWDMVPYQGNEQKALQQMLAVRDNLRDQGFTATEFNAEKEKMYNGMKDVLEAKGLGTPDNALMLFRQNFLYDIPVQDFRGQINRNLETLVELEVEDMNAWMKSLLNDNNLAFVTYSKSQSEMNITENDLMAALKAKSSFSDMARADGMKPISQLIDFPLTGGKIVSEKQLKTLQAKEWTLSNGAKVLYRNVPELSGKFLFAGSAEGGKSIVPAQELANYNAMRSLLMQSGVYNYNRNQLAQWLQGKDINLSLSLEDYSDGIGGNAPVDKADDFFSYLYLILSRQNFSKSAFDKYIQRNLYVYENRATTGMAAVQDSIQQLLYPVSAMNPRQDEAFFKSVQFDKLQEQFQAHLGDASRFTYCLIGDIPEAKAKELVLRYIGSLKGEGKPVKTTIQPMDFSSSTPVIKRTFETETEGGMAEIEISFANKQKLSEREQAALEVMRGLLERRYFDVLREKEHLTYTVGVQSNYTSQPVAGESLNIHLSTAKENADKAVSLVYSILDDVKAGRFTADEFKAAMVPLAVDEEQSGAASQSNSDPSVWMALLNIYAETGNELSPNDNAASAPVFKTLTPQDITAVAMKVMTNAKQREIIVKPAAQEGKHTFK
ncbi:peptidase M16 inactive domain protein [Prevotella melaninogenica ATCC 25845]|nr:peptidase M16 inactive domain protein [Prevotella melaninogenica ATCC 25845]ASE17909.1 insulinase family protein [Prevotella melaninogenica]